MTTPTLAERLRRHLGPRDGHLVAKLLMEEAATRLETLERALQDAYNVQSLLEMALDEPPDEPPEPNNALRKLFRRPPTGDTP